MLLRPGKQNEQNFLTARNAKNTKESLGLSAERQSEGANQDPSSLGSCDAASEDDPSFCPNLGKIVMLWFCGLNFAKRNAKFEV